MEEIVSRATCKFVGKLPYHPPPPLLLLPYIEREKRIYIPATLDVFPRLLALCDLCARNRARDVPGNEAFCGKSKERE